METVFITGFPGFLASELIPHLAASRRRMRFDCLVESRFEPLARAAAARLSARTGNELRVFAGDITERDLGLGSRADDCSAGCREIFHLAAVYDLGVSRERAQAVNVDGTRHTLEFARRCADLERFHHVSTCYVSGRHEGRFRESDLDVGQRFGNHYEATKYLSEKLVHDFAEDETGTTVYRPSIVTGDSITGTAPKMDGPYFFIQWLLHQPRFCAALPVLPGSRETTMNIVPSDYVTRAMAELSTRRDKPLAVYALADPAPLTIPALTEVLGRLTERRVIGIPSPRHLARTLMGVACRLHPSLEIPSEAIDYLSHPAHYDSGHAAAALEGSGIACPRFPDYADKLVSFVRRTLSR